MFVTLDAGSRTHYLKTMAIRTIIEVPDKRLKTISRPLPAVNDATRTLMDDMLETMYHANGIGLAAIQVGVPERVIVMDLSASLNSEKEEDGEAAADGIENTDQTRYQTRYQTGQEDVHARATHAALVDEGPRYFVNPEIIWASAETRNYQEGCLSVPGFYDDVERPAQCRVHFFDYQGEAQELDCDGLLATCIQHEIDHLNGIVFLDHLSRLKRDRWLKKIHKAERDAASAAR